MPAATMADLRESYSQNAAYNQLMPVIIDRALLEASRKWSPLARALPRKTWPTLDVSWGF